jgi:dTDP-4-amino-4,6-dideoxygalactose transaminase
MHGPFIPVFSLSRQVKTLEKDINKVFSSILESQQFIGGNFVEEFEKRLEQYLNAKFVISCNSGTDALWLALKALDIEQNDIVLTTPFSFIASSSEIVSHRAHPVFIDIDEKTYNINPELLSNWLQNNAIYNNGQTIHKSTGFKIKGIIPVNLFGQCADYSIINNIAREWGLWVVEDAAQSIGAKYNNKSSGTLGDIGCFSFYPTKNLGAFGDGGCCVTDSEVLAEKILCLRNHGRKTHYDYQSLGVNSRLDGIQAAILSLKLDYLDQWTERRRQIASYYTKELSEIPFIKVPLDIFKTHVYHLYSVLIKDSPGINTRDSVAKYLEQNGIGARIVYPKALTQMDFLKTHKDLVTNCPVVQKVIQEIISLPMWPELTDQEVFYVIDTLKALALDKNVKKFQEHTDVI